MFAIILTNSISCCSSSYLVTALHTIKTMTVLHTIKTNWMFTRFYKEVSVVLNVNNGAHVSLASVALCGLMYLIQIVSKYLEFIII